MKELTVRKNDAGQRLDRFITKAVPLLPESLLQKYIRIKRIKVNSKGAKRDLHLSEGDVLQLYINDEFFEKPREENSYLKVGVPRLDIIYEDENILLVDKKPGVLCHSTGAWDHNTLVANVQARAYQLGEWSPREEHAFAPALCNRIDRNTGGIVIAAKNAEALRAMNDKIQTREVGKYYLCVVVGKPSPAEGTIESYLIKNEDKNRVFLSDTQKPGSKLTITHYKTLASRDGLSLVECQLRTGRTHQIRAQMASRGWPLLGDVKYGNERENKSRGETGQLLYSYRISFTFETVPQSLEGLAGQCFQVPSVGFVEKYFRGIRF